ncbi:hypothetical protein CKO15_08355 [Halorhodospira abdelmalekii]|uniref:Na+/H+ antiporter subunit E n=1 Tax=Halorhodospira abdelmalekii TaxID=421629 RepID=UPI0019090253|nr:Na+/H+ antiporter subunit E [Halorhodospira abdelmalekii]MBK1735298.1 hypothetical protein [Halorhodospira abdelmalekii]
MRRYFKALLVVVPLWLILTGGALGGLFGLVTVLAAAFAAVLYVGPWTHRWRWLRMPRFILFFLQRSLIGAIDVGYRALHPRLPLHPGWMSYRLRLPSGEPRVAMVALVSLLPGTLAADLYGDELVVHVIVPDAEPEIRRLESHIGVLYGCLATGESGESGESGETNETAKMGTTSGQSGEGSSEASSEASSGQSAGTRTGPSGGSRGRS